MIRTALSFCVLFGALAAASRWLSEPAHHDLPKAAGEAAPAFEPRSEEAKPSAPASAHAFRMLNDRAIQLVAFEEPIDEVFDGLKPINGVKSRIDDEESAEGKTDSGSIAPIVTPPKEPEIAMTPQLVELRSKLREALAYYYFRPENVALRSPWGAMHAMIAYGVDSELITGDKRVNAIGYLC